MIVGIHQPHFFPWIGYFDKMAKSDVFVLLDEVQMEKGSYMYRNRIVDVSGKVSYLTISADKHGFLDKKFNEIQTKNQDVWMTKHLDTLEKAYSKCDCFDEVFPYIKNLYSGSVTTVCDFDIKTIKLVVKMLGISTKLLLQSEMQSVEEGKKNDLVLNICKALGADCYLSGNGARKYTDEKTFSDINIDLQYQTINIPVYKQRGTDEFVSGLSILDMLFNIGIDETKKLFWEMVSQGNEFSVK